MPQLTELYLAENVLKTIKDLTDLPNLKRLHLRQNEIESLDETPDFPSLEYLNLRENKIENVAEIGKLAHLKTLKELNMLGTPVADDKGDDFGKEVIILNGETKFVKINKEETTPELFEEANALKAERKAAEEEAAKAAAEAAAAGEGGEEPAE